jgi:hypothetical protein
MMMVLYFPCHRACVDLRLHLAWSALQATQSAIAVCEALIPVAFPLSLLYDSDMGLATRVFRAGYCKKALRGTQTAMPDGLDSS